jgi:hypothetical protein
MKRINKYIGDPRFLEILNKFLLAEAGYIEPKTGDLVQPEIGTPQGGVLSPLLCNIVLHELDKYMADTEIKFSKGKTRKIKPIYKSIANKRFSLIDPVERLNLLIERRKTRRSLMADPNYRRLDYIRYADDFIVLVSGSFKDAKYIQNNIKEYIKANCGLELNQNKTIISNILNNEWSFLGAKMKKLKIKPEWRVKHVNGTKVGIAKLPPYGLLCCNCFYSYNYKNNNEMNFCTCSNENASKGIKCVNVSIDKLLGILKKSGFVRQNKLGKFIPKAYTAIINLTHYEIVSFYNSKIKGIFNFYNCASNRTAFDSIF